MDPVVIETTMSVSTDGERLASKVRLEDKEYKATRVICWSTLIALALVDTWAGRQYTDPDGISYLDSSDVLLRHNWHLLINPHWSPLYPFLIGIATWAAHPTPYWELPLTHALNLVIFIGARASFEFLLRQVIRVPGQWQVQCDRKQAVPLPAWCWQLAGYGLFAWSTLVLVSGVRRINPDLCVAAFVFLDAGLVLKLRTCARKGRIALLLGLVLGAGYLAKAVMFPIAFVFMAVAFFAVGDWRKALLPLCWTLVVFSAVAAPLVVAISNITGRPSFSESGSLNVAWQINGGKILPFYLPEGAMILEHPMELLHRHPNVFAFRGPVESTYSPWHDPWFWNAGANTGIGLQNQLRAIGRNLAAFIGDRYMVPTWGLIVGGGLVLLSASSNAPRRPQFAANSWPLLIPGMAGLASYGLVLVQARYIAPFLVLVALGLFPYMLVQKRDGPSRRSEIVIAALAVCMIVASALVVTRRLVAPLPELKGHGGLHFEVAEALNREGLLPGQSVAIIGSGWDGMIWARLARVQIIAQIPPESTNDFWRASDASTKAEVYAAFEKTGARAVVTDELPPTVGFAEWQRVGNTPYFIHFLTSLADKRGGKSAPK